MSLSHTRSESPRKVDCTVLKACKISFTELLLDLMPPASFGVLMDRALRSFLLYLLKSNAEGVMLSFQCLLGEIPIFTTNKIDPGGPSRTILWRPWLTSISWGAECGVLLCWGDLT